MNKKELKQENIRLGTHGEDYGSWMSNPVFYIIGGITALAVVVCLWRRRDHGTGSPGRSLSSGL